jgi:DeoR family glycerol-3-phosphate regulon repressor
VRSFRVRHVILSIGAVDPVGGEFLDYHLAEAEFSQAAMGQAERVTVVADHSKFSNKGLVKVCDLDQVHCFVTDQAPPGSFRDALAARHAALVVAEPAGEP